jgi:hypothetical protein
MADGEIVDVILDTPLCTSCIALKTGASEVIVLMTLRKVSRTLAIEAASGQCRDCSQPKQTYMVRSRH